MESSAAALIKLTQDKKSVIHVINFEEKDLVENSSDVSETCSDLQFCSWFHEFCFIFSFCLIASVVL